jgi:Asp-tRNA(Asn)/Glu-tRNA(Gln) amidotransferase C subunit|tara:strand:- start:3300 stop:3536 length:237 start_codon:yes stop_codon:yes gene_type:complete
MTAAQTGLPNGDDDMASEQPLSREDFDHLAKLMGIDGELAYLDGLYSQARGVFISAKSISDIDVTGAEPDMAFIPKKD